MFIDARTLPEGTRIEADVIIVGAGAAGITLARDLAGEKRQVVLFESGGFDFSAETQALYEGEAVGQPYTPLDVDRLRYFGGSTNHWGGGCFPFPAAEFKTWPFGRDVLDDYYRRAQEICQLGPFTYSPEDWKTEQSRPLSFAIDSPIRTGVHQDSPPTRFGEVYRHDLASASGLTVYLNANLLDIETDENARTVTGLQVGCFGGHRFRARAKHYILASGGIENPRLLLNSNKAQKQGLGNAFDLVGRYFMDHAEIGNTATILFSGSPEETAFYSDHNVRGHEIGGYLYFDPPLQEKEGFPPLAFGLSVGSLPDKDQAKESLQLIYRNLLAGRIPDHFTYYLSRIMRGVEWMAEASYERVFSKGVSVLSTFYNCGSPPDPESRVTLMEDVDALGMRKVKLNWRLPSNFEQTMRRAHEVLAQELGRAGLGRLRINSKETGYDPMQYIQNGHHEMGTTRMHLDPRQGVVDANCQVHGIANLFVAGSSVFPSYSFDNPTLTIVALALRLSDHLKKLSS
jgi:choline dehydrogenase-like flavoprotein